MYLSLPFLLMAIILSLKPVIARASENDPYQRLLLKGARLISVHQSKKVYRLKEDKIVWVKKAYGTENYIYVLSSKGKPLYKTLRSNTSSFNEVNQIFPKIDPLKIHHIVDLDQEALPQHMDNKWSAFASFSLEQSSSQFYGDLFSSTHTRLGGLRVQLNQYYIYHKLPVHLGLHLSTYRQGWSDGEATNDATIFNASWGPTFMTSFWKEEKSIYNVHLSFFRSMANQVSFRNQTFDLTSVGYQLQVEKELLIKGKPLLLGAHYRYTKHNVDEISSATQFTDEGSEKTLGLSVGYRFNWTL